MSGKYSIIYSINNAYVPYLWCNIKSLEDFSSSQCNVYILHSGISEQNMENILSLQKENVCIYFVDMRQHIDKETQNAFALTEHFTIETYYRFFLPNIFPDLDKVLYIDADTLVLYDIKELCDIDIGDNYLGVTHDCEIMRACAISGDEYSDYFTKTLGVDVKQYFQAGVMIVNLKKWREDNITQKLIDGLKKIQTPKFVDQDILNMICQKKVKFIPQNWNYTWHLPLIDKDYFNHIPTPYNLEYEQARFEPFIAHFTGNKMKPVDYPNLPAAKKFWEYAKDSPYYDQLMLCMVKNHEKCLKKIKKIRLKILKYKFLNILTLGLFSKKYMRKIQKKEAELRALTEYIGL